MIINSLGSQNLDLRDLLKIRRVDEVMNIQVVHAAPDTSVMDIACLMSEHQVSFVVIVEQSQDEQEQMSLPLIPLGIITEYDIVQFQALELDFTQTQVRTIMSSPLFYLRPEDSLWSANEQMQSLRVRQLVVVGNQGELLGSLSQSNILQVLDPIKFYEVMELLQHQVAQQQTQIIELMTDRRQLEEQLQQRLIELKTRAKREQLITSIALRIRESLDLNTALMTVAEDVRYMLKADRVLVYQFAPDMNGKILAESAINGWTTVLGSEIKNISWSGVEDIFLYGKKQAIANIYELNLTDGQLQILEQLQIKSCLIVPILISNQLWGLLIANQCSAFRQWKEDEVNLLDKIAIQLAVAIKQVELYNQATIQLAERHKIEAQLRLERNFISTVLNVAGALIVVLDYQGRIVNFNHACEQTTGYTYNQVQGKCIWDFLLIPEEIESVKAAFQNLKHRQIHNHYENYWLTKNGETRLISWSNNVLLNRDEQVEYIVCTGIDITENRKAEEELRHTRNFLQSMIDNLPVAVFVKDARPEKFGKFQLLNKACEHIFGLKGEHAIGKTDYDFFPKEQAEFFLQKDIETISHGLPQDIPEEPIDSYSLGRRILHTKKVPLYDKYNQPEYLLCISEDITERKEAEEKLRQAKEQLQTVLDAVPGFVSWVSSDGHYLGVNKHLAQSFNLTADAFIGQELGFMQKSPHFTEFMSGFLANQDVAVSSVIDSHIGNTTRSYLLVAQKYQQNTAAVAVGIDITEHKQTETALAESEAMLRSVLDSTPSFVSMVNREGKVLFVNQTIPELSVEEVIGTNIDYYVFSEDCHIQRSALKRVFEHGEVVSYETRGVNIDGSFTYNHSQAGPIWRDGQVTAAVIVTNDISDRKQAEAALRESEQKFRLFTENIKSTFWIADLKGDSSQVVYVSPAFEEIWGLSAEEAYTSYDIFLQAIHPADRQRFIADRPKRMQNEYSEEYRIIRPDGAIRWIHSHAFPVKNEKGQVYRITGIAEDITERKQAEIALQNLVESTASTTGQDFFPALVQYISSALDVRHACVSELINKQLHTLGFWSDGQLKPNIFYDPTSKPCEILLQQGVYYCCCGVQQLFPNFEVLALMQADSFMGVTLSNDFGEPIGTLWIVDEKPITDPDKFEGILKVFAARAAAELQRQRAQEALQQLNRELESRVEQRTLELQKSEAELKRQFAAVEAAIDGIAILSQDIYTYVNKAHVEMFGYNNADELIGKSWQEIYKTSEIHSFQTEVFPVLMQQKHWRGETIAKRKDGTTFDEEVSLTISEQGDLICVCRDISQRKEAERLIEEQKTFLRSIIDNNPNCIFVKDTAGKFLLVNKAMASFHNTTIQEMVGKADIGFYTDAELQGFKNFDQAVLTRLQPIQMLESSTKKATGEQRYFQSIKVPLIASNGEVRGILSVATDITERKLAQDALQQQIERERLVNFITQRIRESLDLQAILNVAVAEIHKLLKVDRVLIYHILTDGTGKVIAEALTPRYASILEQSFPVECFPTECYLRYAQGEIYALCDRKERQQPSCLIQFMEDMQIRAKLVIPIVQQGVLWGLLIAHQCSHPREWKTGEIELLQQLANQLAIATKQSGLYAQLQVELSDRKQAETELRQVKERLEFLISSSPAVIFTAKPLTRNYYPTYISENVINLVGYSAEEFLSEPDFWLNHIHPEDTPQIVENLPQLVQTGHHTQEYRWLHRDGQYRWMFDELKLVRDQHGNPLEIIGLWMEISDRKKAEEDIRKALEKEKELSDLKSRFISMTSHEFRTPLAVIASSAGILESFSHKLDHQQKQKHLRCIQTYVQHTTRLLDDILLINKAEAGKLAFEPTDIDLNDFCSSLVEELKLSSPNHTLIFSAQYLGNSPANSNFTAHLDKKLLRQILSNLLSNAVKYSPDGSNVQINLLMQDESVVFLITDEGIGISKEEQQNLFESFYRASNVGNIPGTGLGLTIVKKCVELQGGEITVASDIGAGTTFRVELPLFTST